MLAGALWPVCSSVGVRRPFGLLFFQMILSLCQELRELFVAEESCLSDIDSDEAELMG